MNCTIIAPIAPYLPTHSRKHICKPTRANALTKALSKSLQMPARVTAFQDGFRITHWLFIFSGVRESLRFFAHAKKNKIICASWIG